MFTPPAHRWWAIGVLAAELLLTIFALFHQLIPSAGWYALAFKVNIAISAGLTIYFAYAFWANPQTLDVQLGPFKKWVAILSAPALIYFLGYIAIIYGVGNLAGLQSGQQAHQLKDVFEKEYVETRKGCKTRLQGESLKQAMPKYFCVSKEHFDLLPQRVAVNLVGNQSYFGFQLDHIEYDWQATSQLKQP